MSRSLRTHYLTMAATTWTKTVTSSGCQLANSGNCSSDSPQLREPGVARSMCSVRKSPDFHCALVSKRALRRRATMWIQRCTFSLNVGPRISAAGACDVGRAENAAEASLSRSASKSKPTITSNSGASRPLAHLACSHSSTRCSAAAACRLSSDMCSAPPERSVPICDARLRAADRSSLAADCSSDVVTSVWQRQRPLTASPADLHAVHACGRAALCLDEQNDRPCLEWGQRSALAAPDAPDLLDVAVHHVMQMLRQVLHGLCSARVGHNLSRKADRAGDRG